MIDARQFRDLVVTPTLQALHPLVPYSEARRELLLGTALVESSLHYLKQIKGPALGLFQIEPATHVDVWDNYLAYRPDLASAVRSLASQGWPERGVGMHAELVTNLGYSCAVAAIIYRRAPAPLPPADDVGGMGYYWKQHYNTPLGKGTPEKFIGAYMRGQPLHGGA